MPYTLPLFANTGGTINSSDQAVAGTLMERPAGGGPTYAGSMGFTQINTGSITGGVAATTTAASITLTGANTTYPMDCTSNAIAVTLPSANANIGLVLVIEKIDSGSNHVNIGPAGSDTIEGATGATAVAITSQWGALKVRSIGNLTWIKN